MYRFQMLCRGHHPRRREFEFAPSKVLEVVRDQVFHTAGNGQFEDVIIRRIGQVWPPPEVNRLPDGGRAEVVEQGLSFRCGHRHAPPEAFPLDQFFILRKQSGPHDGLVRPGKTPIQDLRTCAFRTAQCSDEDIGVLNDFHEITLVSPAMSVKQVVGSVLELSGWPFFPDVGDPDAT